MKTITNLPRRGAHAGIRFFSSVKLLFIAFLFGLTAGAGAQDYFVPGPRLWANHLPEFFCGACQYNLKGDLGLDWSGGISFDPDSTLYILSNNMPRIYEVNHTNASSSLLFETPVPLEIMDGFVAMGGGLFYSIPRWDQPTDDLYAWDLNAGTVTAVGTLPYPPYSEMWLLNGMLHYISWEQGQNTRKIIRMAPGDVSSAEIVVEFKAQHPIYSLTATPYASVVVGIDKSYFGYEHFVSVSLGDGTVTDICKIPKAVGHTVRILTSMYEHIPSSVANFIDLDCNDSSLATNSDYNSKWIDCLTEGGVPVTDHDIKTIIDSPIRTMTITVANPEDGDQEIFFSTGDVPGIIVEGDNTPVLTLKADGDAKIAHFEAALKLVRYDDAALYPTPGMRTIMVEFETTEGNTSNVGHAFVEVRFRSQIVFDMGPAVEMCEGSAVTLDANIQFVNYEWSTGETTQLITVDEPGIYSVSVSSSLKCPAMDEIEVVELPVIQVNLLGDDAVCREEEATLTIETNSPFPIDVEILVNGGNTIWLYGVEDSYSFPEWPYNITEYTINEIIPSEAACIEAWDDYQVIEVYQDVAESVSLPMCEGDSVLIQNTWVNAAGSYPVELQTVHGCDSIVTYEVTFNPSILKTIESFTCNPATAGTFVTTLVNPNGCDTLLTSHVILTPADTVQQQLTTCSQANAGVFQTILQNQAGCDSVILSTIIWVPPVDSTYRSVITCDATQHGTFVHMLSGQDGCDSIVVTQVMDGVPVETHLSMTSCDPNQVGVFENHYLTATQCDSNVITTVTYAEQSTVFFTSTTCDPSQAGVFVQELTAASGCDSIVTTTITLLPASETYINSTTCDPQQAGSFTYALSNQYGCDSTVHETITLLASQDVLLNSTTCNESEAGTYVNTFTNQAGCDSIVTSVVTYVAVDTQLIEFKTCDPTAVSTIETMYTSQGGCDSLVIEATTLHPLPAVAIEAMTDFNGYGVSCHGMTDASLEAITTGIGPWTYSWSTGDVTKTVSQVGVGNYTVAVTDANGCIAITQHTIAQPEPLTMESDVRQPECVELQFGEISVAGTGGVPPLQFALDNSPFQSHGQFSSLGNGVHTIIVRDANGCEVTDEFSIQSLTGVSVDLGEDHDILKGETIQLNANVTIDPDSILSIEWIGLPNACGHCVSQLITPQQDLVIIVIVTDVLGCIATDEITIEVREPQTQVFFPNVFSPNGDGINDHWLISSGSDVTLIEALSIFDRWGNLVYSDNLFPPNDPAYGWNGTFDGKTMNPGVYVFKALVQVDGGVKLVYGDITLIR